MAMQWGLIRRRGSCLRTTARTPLQIPPAFFQVYTMTVFVEEKPTFVLTSTPGLVKHCSR